MANSTNKTWVFTLAALTMSAVTAPVLGGDFAKEHGIPLEAGCSKLTDKIAILRCGMRYFDRVTAEAKKEQAEAEKEEADAIKRAAEVQSREAEAQKMLKAAKQSDIEVAAAELCFAFIKQGIGAERLKRDEILQAANGKISVDNACQVASKFGYEHRAVPVP